MCCHDNIGNNLSMTVLADPFITETFAENNWKRNKYKGFVNDYLTCKEE